MHSWGLATQTMTLIIECGSLFPLTSKDQLWGDRHPGWGKGANVFLVGTTHSSLGQLELGQSGSY